MSASHPPPVQIAVHKTLHHLTPFYSLSTLCQVKNVEGKITSNVGKQTPAAHRQKYSDTHNTHDKVKTD